MKKLSSVHLATGVSLSVARLVTLLRGAWVTGARRPSERTISRLTMRSIQDFDASCLPEVHRIDVQREIRGSGHRDISRMLIRKKEEQRVARARPWPLRSTTLKGYCRPLPQAAQSMI